MTGNYPRWLLRLLSRPPLFFYRLGLGALLGRKVMLLTTTGRKTGIPRTTPLQYERYRGAYYVGSMRGASADWYKNLVADPNVSLQIGRKTIRGRAEPIEEPEKVFEFIRYRLDKNPVMIGAILRFDGLSSAPDENELRDYARGLTLAAIRAEG
ncbi:MAG: nitroreductase/quinone reductase family protein [Anaerolineales bacterium]|nr:nitroreductase/quinone reductase family protein [Anaerolineales bacterium]